MGLTKNEQALLNFLPKPPATGYIKKPTIVWIIEWLALEDQPTGKQLHDWMFSHGPVKAKYFKCKSKKEVLNTIDRATLFASRQELLPVPMLHIEAHGGEDCLEGPSGSGGREQLYWHELTPFLQNLNLLTRCNLAIFIAACTGFAGIKVFFQGPIAPAAALVGPAAIIAPCDLLSSTKEFYRRWKDHQPLLNDMAESASREAGNVIIELEPFVLLAYEAIIEHLIISKRPHEQLLQKERIKNRMFSYTSYSPMEIEGRIAKLLPLSPEMIKKEYQYAWNQLFMIDIFPEGQESFGVNWSNIIDIVENH